MTVAYELGEWDHAVELAGPARARDLTEGGPASIEAALAYVRAARGVLDVDRTLASTRPYWREDTRIAVQVGVACVDVLGHEGHVERMLALHDEVVTFLRDAWEQPRVMVEVRLAAVALGHLATAVRAGSRSARSALLDAADRLHDAAAAVWGPGSRLAAPTGEGRMWLARADAEYRRVRWSAGEEMAPEELADAWRQVRRLADERGDRYEAARAEARLGEVLAAAGRPGAVEASGRAREVATALGAAALLEDLRRALPESTTHALTPREHEVLALLGQGRSNGEIGRTLFISTKTASVHVSNILAKLGAGSRGEAVAAARAAGLLE